MNYAITALDSPSSVRRHRIAGKEAVLMKFFCFALPPDWADTHPAPGVPIRFFYRLSRECWLWLALQGWDDPEESAY